MLINSTAKDVLLTTALDGLPANFLAPSIEAAGLDLAQVKAMPPGQVLDRSESRGRYKKIFSAGQGVGMVGESRSTVDICDEIIEQFEQARAAFGTKLAEQVPA